MFSQPLHWAEFMRITGYVGANLYAVLPGIAAELCRWRLQLTALTRFTMEAVCAPTPE